MSSVKLQILTPNLTQQRYSCHGCGNCCRDFTVQLRAEDVAKLAEQEWEERLGEPVTVTFRGTTYLRQRDDGACVFWMEDGRCRIHAEFGFEAKPVACQLFPFSLTPARGGAMMGVNFACQSVLENKGADLRSHVADLRRMARSLPEVGSETRAPMLTKALRATDLEVQDVTSRVDAWLRRDDVDLRTRIDGLAWVVQSLEVAKLDAVRDRRFADLLDVLFGALPDELAHRPIRPASARQRRLLRQAAFARTEDPKIGRVLTAGRGRTVLSQVLRSRRFASGRGEAPSIGLGWPAGVSLASVEAVCGAGPVAIAPIDDLMTRWLRATVLGGRAWGAGFYGWPVVRGLAAMMLNVSVVGWLARLHAAGRDSTAAEEGIDVTDVRAALGRVDRTAGRAKWLGSAAETMRLRYLVRDEGLRRLAATYGFDDSGD